MLVKTPGFTAVVVLTLALGIGANTAIFSFLDRIFLRELSVARPDELVTVRFSSESGVGVGSAFNYPLYADYRDQSEVFSGLAAYSSQDLTNVTVAGSTEQLVGMSVSDNYFSVLGVKPFLGRTFMPKDDRRPNSDPVVVISHELWQQKFAGDNGVLGQTILWNNHPLQIVGVTPPEFTGTIIGMGPAVYVSLGTWETLSGRDVIHNRGYTWLSLLGRLKPGVSRAQAQANLRVLAEQIYAVAPNNTHRSVLITDGSRGGNAWGKGERLPMVLFQISTALILLIACANVANMLLARGMTRQKELAIRRAIGASRGEIIRQLLVESSLLALLAGACGALLAHWLCGASRSILPLVRKFNMPTGVDDRILLFAMFGSLGLVLVFGLAPALRMSRPNVMATLKDGSGAVTALTRRWPLRNLLVVAQVAVSVIAMAFGALCIRSVHRLHVADPGFDSDQILAVTADLKVELPAAADGGQVFGVLKDRAASLPNVRAVCLTMNTPLSIHGHFKTGATHIDDFQMPEDEDSVSWEFFMISPGYFRTLGVPLLKGRDFSLQDGPGAPRVMVVNELLAQRYWPGQDPIGKRVTLFRGEVREVVGVVKTVKLHSVREEPVPLSFLPLAQPMEFDGGLFPSSVKPVLLARIQGDHRPVASFLRDQLNSAALDVAAYNATTLAARARKLLHRQRVVTGLLNAIGAVGLLFVATGIAGLMAYEVSQRTREIGIRMALGARWQDVLGFILRKGTILTVAGLAFGIGLSCISLWIVGCLLPDVRWDYLYGVRIWDPLTYLSVVFLVSLITLAACWLPARRAARIDPMEALRYE
jgi:predicted permease